MGTRNLRHTEFLGAICSGTFRVTLVVEVRAVRSAEVTGNGSSSLNRRRRNPIILPMIPARSVIFPHRERRWPGHCLSDCGRGGRRRAPCPGEPNPAYDPKAAPRRGREERGKGGGRWQSLDVHGLLNRRWRRWMQTGGCEGRGALFSAIAVGPSCESRLSAWVRTRKGNGLAGRA